MCPSGRDRGRLFICLVLIAFAGGSPPPAAAQETRSTEAPAAAITYLLDVTLNGWPLDLVASFRDENGRLSLPADQFVGLGFKLDDRYVTEVGGEKRVYLDRVPGLKWRVDMRAQKIAIESPFEGMTPTQVRVAPGQPKMEARANWGGLLGYDMFAEWSAKPDDPLFARSVSTNFDTRLFSPYFTASSTGFYSIAPDTKSEFVRLDSWVDIDDTESVQRLRLGDSYTAGPVWVRTVRFGGVQWGREFSLRPDIVTMPIPSLPQNLSVPSTVDIFVNGVQRYGSSVNPGAVRLTDLPVVAGANTIRTVVTDQAGRRVEVLLPLYSSNQLLAAGMSSFNVEGGKDRRDYSVLSNSYGDEFLSGSYSRGVSDWITLRGYAATVPGLSYGSGGAGATFSIGSFILLDGALQFSDDGMNRGKAFYAGFERVTQNFSVSGSYARGDKNYQDLASIFGYTRFIEQVVGSVSANFDRAGQANLAFVRQVQSDGQTTNVISPSYSVDVLPHKLRLGLSAYTETLSKDKGAFISLTFPLGENMQGYAQHSQRNGRPSDDIQLTGDAYDQRLQYQFEAARGDYDGAAAQADWDGRRADLFFRAASANGSTGIQAGVAQSLVIMKGGPYVAGRVDDGFSVVEVEKSPKVKVSLENRPYGQTDSDGRIFVDGLQSYAPNAISIDPLDLPLDADIADTAVLVAPRARAGMVTHFGVTRARSAIVVLKLPDGATVPVGAMVRPAGAEDRLVVGFDGEVYLRGIATGRNHLEVTWPNGSCVADFTAEVAEGRLPRLGPFPCVPPSSR